jgi:hypothetical protein
MSRVKRRPPRRLIVSCALAGALVATWPLRARGRQFGRRATGGGTAVAAPPTATPIKHVIVIHVRQRVWHVQAASYLLNNYNPGYNVDGSLIRCSTRARS